MSDTVATMGDAGKAMPVPRGQYSDTETYEYLDFVYCGDASYIAKKLTTGNPPAEENEYWQLFARGGTLTENSDVSNTTVTFEQAENRANIFSKESLKNMMGKVSKMYSDLKSIAFSGKYTDLEGRVTITNNDLANIPGTAWDAVRGAQIRKDLDKLNSDLYGFHYIDAYYKTGYGDVICNNLDQFRGGSNFIFRTYNLHDRSLYPYIPVVYSCGIYNVLGDGLYRTILLFDSTGMSSGNIYFARLLGNDEVKWYTIPTTEF